MLSWLEDSKSAEVINRPCTIAIGHAKHAFTLAMHVLRYNTLSYEVRYRDAELIAYWSAGALCTPLFTLAAPVCCCMLLMADRC